MAQKRNEPQAEVKLVRRNVSTGDIENRKRGRPSPEFINGYIIDGKFHEGNPPKKRGRKGRGGRPKGSKNRNTKGAVKQAGGLNEIELIVRREVEARLKAAKAAALQAFNSALSL